MNQKETRVDKWMNLFELLQLSEEEQKAAQAYLSGEEGSEALHRIGFKDLSGIDPKSVTKMFYDLIRKVERNGLQPIKEEIGRLFQLLFARGKTTCHEMVPSQIFRILEPTEWKDPAKMIAVYSTNMAMGSYYPQSYIIKFVLGLTGGDPQVLKQALTMEVSAKPEGRFFLLALYFYKKRLTSSKPLPTLDKEELLMFNTYEEISVIFFGTLYFGSVDQPLLEELSEALSSGEIPERFKALVGAKLPVPEKMLRLTAGLSYLNYMYSEKLKNIVRLCLLADLQNTLEALLAMSRGINMDICTRGGSYDKVFGIDSEAYLSWAVKGDHKNIIRRQLEENTECYLRVMDAMPIGWANQMMMIIKEQKPDLYQNLVDERRQNGNHKEKEKLITALVKWEPNPDVATAWLRGESTFERFCADYDRDTHKNSYGGHYEWGLLSCYYENYKDEDFFRRVEVYMFFRGLSVFFEQRIMKQVEWGLDNLEKARIRKLFEELEMEGLSLSMLLSVAGMINECLDSEKDQKTFHNCIEKYFGNCLEKRREEMVDTFYHADVYGRCVGLQVLSKDAAGNKVEILKYSQDGSKVVKQQLCEILCRQKDWEGDVKEFLASKKAAERELAIRVLLVWQGAGADYKELFTQALEKEKNAKVRELLGNALGMESDQKEATSAKKFSRPELVKELHKGGKKRGLAWAYKTPFSVVHVAASADTSGQSIAEEEYLQALLLCYSSADGCGVSEKAAFLAEILDAAELAVYMNELFEKWMEAGAEAKKRWVLYAAAIHGGSVIIEKLLRQIKEWPQEARGAIACEAVKALSLNPLPEALLSVDGIARKFKFKQVRAAAGEALAFAAAQLGITREELEDRIVPDLGFDGSMERIFDYGVRKFIVTVTTALEIEVFEGVETDGADDGTPRNLTRGKKLKTLPAPGKKDDEAKAAAAYEEFKLMKKQMKTTVTSQKQRLEMALSTAREWGIDAWKQLFVKNPIMHQFAIGLIWGIYNDGRLTQSFRYMEDGSFNTEEEDEFELPEQGKIGLVHPIELTEDSREAWKEQLADYEIVQPFEQLIRAVYVMTEEEAGTQGLTRFQGRTVNDLALGSRLAALGWYRGSVQDAGGFDTYYREDKEIGLGVELHFSGSYVGYSNEDVTIDDARFYKAGTIARGSYVYDVADKEKALFLRDIPARYFSEIVWQLTKVVM
ncbi:MAG: DUF4132 domain-containing protein [Lachnospiraceae bacterium]|nr:DUF4132 domain-containing protein [Lachnospiraceae bacterium]